MSFIKVYQFITILIFISLLQTCQSLSCNQGYYVNIGSKTCQPCPYDQWSYDQNESNICPDEGENSIEGRKRFKCNCNHLQDEKFPYCYYEQEEECSACTKQRDYYCNADQGMQAHCYPGYYRPQPLYDEKCSSYCGKKKKFTPQIDECIDCQQNEYCPDPYNTYNYQDQLSLSKKKFIQQLAQYSKQVYDGEIQVVEYCSDCQVFQIVNREKEIFLNYYYDSNEESIYFVFRGSSKWQNHLTNINANLDDISDYFCNNCKVHDGFNQATLLIINDIQDTIKIIMELINIKRIIFTGHSLGGALATLSLYRISQIFDKRFQYCLFTYGSPRVGNVEFSNYINTVADDKNNYRITFDGDPIPTIRYQDSGYYHVGQNIHFTNLTMYFIINHYQMYYDTEYIFNSFLDIDVQTYQLTSEFFNYWEARISSYKGLSLDDHSMDENYNKIFGNLEYFNQIK